MTPTPHSLKNQFVRADDFARLRLPRELAVSPDGRLLAVTVQRCDLGKRKYFAHIHVLDPAVPAATQWTFGEVSDRGLCWSPDGRQLAFVRSERGQDRIYVFSRQGGAPRERFAVRGSIAAVKWLNDAELIVKHRAADPDPDADKSIAEGREPKSEAPAVRKITRLAYRMDGDGFLPQARWQLLRLQIDTGAFTPLTRGHTDVEDFDIHPAGSHVAYVTNLHRDPDRHPFHLGVMLLNLQTGRRAPLPVAFGEIHGIAFSPDGRYLAYIGHHNLRDGWNVETLRPHLVNLQTGAVRCLTPRIDRQAGDQTVSDLGYGLSAAVVRWSADSRRLYYQLSHEGDVYLARCGLRPGEPERVWNAAGYVPVFAAGGAGLALVHLDFTRLAEIHFCADSTAARLDFRPIAVFNRDYLATREMGKVREIRFRSGDGTPVHGWLVTPPRFNPRRRYPAILEVHGGPRTQYGRVFFHEMQYLAAQGFVVFYTNPRGSQGYGKAFAGNITAAWGTDDFNDVMAAADWLEAQPFVDRKRIGITGGSYGGYMTNLAVGRTHRFRAAVTQRSVVDLRSFEGTSDIGYHNHYEFGGTSWENARGYEIMSPLHYANKIRTPLLIIHSEQDLRCSIEQAEQLFARLMLRGRAPVEFWRFPDESHGLSRGGRPDRRVIRLEGIAAWFKKYMR